MGGTLSVDGATGMDSVDPETDKLVSRYIQGLECVHRYVSHIHPVIET